MAGKQAKILTPQQILAALRRVRHGRYPQRDRVMILLSFKAGLRAGEIAKLTWSMILDADGGSPAISSCTTWPPRSAAVALFLFILICAAHCCACDARPARIETRSIPSSRQC